MPVKPPTRLYGQFPGAHGLGVQPGVSASQSLFRIKSKIWNSRYKIKTKLFLTHTKKYNYSLITHNDNLHFWDWNCQLQLPSVFTVNFPFFISSRTGTGTSMGWILLRQSCIPGLWLDTYRITAVLMLVTPRSPWSHLPKTRATPGIFGLTS